MLLTRVLWGLKLGPSIVVTARGWKILAWVYPMFWIFVVVSMPLVGRRYRG
jgi:hypothetical protein